MPSLARIKNSLLTDHASWLYTSREQRYKEMCAAIEKLPAGEQNLETLKPWAMLECEHPQDWEAT